MRMTKLFVVGAALAAVAMLEGCTTAPMKPIPPQVAAIAPTAFVVLADGAVGVAISKGVKPADIATIAYQLEQFASGHAVTVQALTAEIQRLEMQANLNTAQIAAITELRAAFDMIIAGYISGGVISGQAQTTILEILQDVITAAELLGAPAPNPPTADSAAFNSTYTADIGPPAPAVSQRSPSMQMLESPAVIGGATSTLIVASLQAFGHISVAAPAAAAITVLGTFIAAWLEAH